MTTSTDDTAATNSTDDADAPANSPKSVEELLATLPADTANLRDDDFINLLSSYQAELKQSTTPTKPPLPLPAALTSPQRRLVHTIAEELHLQHRTEVNEQGKRQIVVYEQADVGNAATSLPGTVPGSAPPFPPFSPADCTTLLKQLSADPPSLSSNIRIATFNMNSIRAILRNWQGRGISLSNFLHHYQLHILCVQETKMGEITDITADLTTNVIGYDSFWSIARSRGDKVKKGVAGVATYVRKGLTIDAMEGMQMGERYDNEGRIMQTRHPNNVVLFNIYYPNGGMGEDRLQFKLDFYAAFKQRCEALTAEGYKVIAVGDVNTAHNDIDIHNCKIKSTGFLPVERDWLSSIIETLNSNTTPQQSTSDSQPAESAATDDDVSISNASSKLFIDTFRYLNATTRSFTYYDIRSNSRPLGRGWRIDYILIPPALLPHLVQVQHLQEVLGSDHIPVVAEFKPDVFGSSTQHTRPTPVLAACNYAHLKPKKNDQHSLSKFFGKSTAAPAKVQDENSSAKRPNVSEVAASGNKRQKSVKGGAAGSGSLSTFFTPKT